MPRHEYQPTSRAPNRSLANSVCIRVIFIYIKKSLNPSHIVHVGGHVNNSVDVVTTLVPLYKTQRFIYSNLFFVWALDYKRVLDEALKSPSPK